MIRRAFISQAAAVAAAGGVPARRVDQYQAPEVSAMLPAPQGIVVIGRTVLVFGPSGSVVGVFVYQAGTTPGPGNPPIASITNGVSDPYGNAIQSGITSYGAGGVGSFAQLNGGVLSLQDSASHLWAIVAYLSGGTQYLAIENNTTGNFLYVDQLGALIAETPSSPATPESWHNLVPLAGFAAGGTQPQYRLMPDKTVMLTGSVNLVGNQGAGTAFWTQPAGYVTTRTLQQFNPGGNISGGGLINVNAGNLSINSAGTGGNFFLLDGIRYSLT